MEIHDGERIKEYLAITGLSVSEFARRLNCHRQNIYDIFKRKTIDVVLRFMGSQRVDTTEQLN